MGLVFPFPVRQFTTFASFHYMIGNIYSAAQEKDLRLTMLCCSRLCPQCNFMDHATQEKELLLKRIGHITQIISVQPNLPQEKARKSRQVFFTFKVLNGHKKQI